jgi:hypothetical protein
VSVEALMKLPVTLLTREPTGPVDPYGNPAFVVTEFETVCELQQQGATEEEGGALQVTTWRVFLPADAPARGWDAVRLEDGTILELDGDPALWRSPKTGLSHVEAYLRGVE